MGDTAGVAVAASAKAADIVVNAAANATPQDVLGGCNILVSNVAPTDNNYQTFANSYNSLSSSYTAASGNTLWLLLNSFYWNQVNSLISAMTNVVNKNALQQQATALLNTTIGGNYNFTNFANALLNLINACQQEITNEFIEANDPVIYGGFGNYTNYQQNIYNGTKNSGPTTAVDQIAIWEEFKWQNTDYSNMANVPYEITANYTDNLQSSIINNNQFANNGDGFVKDATGLYWYDWESQIDWGNTTAIYNVMTNYQRPGPYGPSGQGIYGKLFKSNSYWQQQQAINTFANNISLLPNLQQGNAINAATSAANTQTVLTIVSTIAKLL